MRPVQYVLADAITVPLYWLVPPVRRWVHWTLNRT